MRTSAERTIKAIEKGEPAPIQLDDIRDDLKALLEENKDLIERLQKLEGRLETEEGEETGDSHAGTP